MKTIRDLLRDADPIGLLSNEPPLTADERVLARQRVVAASPVIEQSMRQRVPIVALVALALIATGVLGTRFWSSGAVDVQAAAVRFEVRLAEENPTGGSHEVKIGQSGATIYLHDEPVVTNSDIESAAMMQVGSVFSVTVEFTAEGAEKMRLATQSHIGRRLAILVDGEVVAVPTIRGAVSTSAVIDGRYTKAEAERIINGIRGR
jgi:preprotein translocase subunit SecD